MADFNQFFDSNAVNIFAESFSVPRSSEIATMTVSPAESAVKNNEIPKRLDHNNNKDSPNKSNNIVTRSTQTLPIPGLVNHNNIIMEETASILIAAMSERDMMIWPLRDHELDLLRCLPFQGPVDHNVCMCLASVSSSLHFQAYRPFCSPPRRA